MAFPITSKYFVKFRHSDTGLTPAFTYYKRTDTLADVTPPPIFELGNGTYYFDVTFNSFSDPDIVFEIDGGTSIPTEEVRYISDTVSPKDYFLDEPVSQVVSDVWNDSVNRAAGTKGNFVQDIGTPAAASGDPNLFGAMLAARDSVKGTGNIDLTGVDTKIGSPRNNLLGAGHVASVSDDIENVRLGVQGVFNAIPSDLISRLDVLHDSMVRILGLSKENTVLDNTDFDTRNNMLRYRLRIFASKADASAGSNPLVQYSVTINYVPNTSNIQSVLWVKDS